MKTELGKISSVQFGFGGCNDLMFGLTYTLQGDGWEWIDFHSHQFCNRMVENLRCVLNKSNKRNINELAGMPIEAAFDNNRKLVSWRILTEAL
jgi:hypothetical protein